MKKQIYLITHTICAFLISLLGILGKITKITNKSEIYYEYISTIDGYRFRLILIILTLCYSLFLLFLITTKKDVSNKFINIPGIIISLFGIFTNIFTMINFTFYQPICLFILIIELGVLSLIGVNIIQSIKTKKELK